jgi:DNA-binding NarL/FixJ family response regulator
MEVQRIDRLSSTLSPVSQEWMMSQRAIMGLTQRELEILRYVAAGETDQAIADTLFLSRRTVNTHVTSILAKMNVRTRTAAATLAVRTGLI